MHVHGIEFTLWLETLFLLILLTLMVWELKAVNETGGFPSFASFIFARKDCKRGLIF